MKPENDYSTGAQPNQSAEPKPVVLKDVLTTIKRSRELIHSAAQPLTAVLALTELLSKAETLDEEAFEDLNVILEQAYLLQDIFHDLNDLLISVDTTGA